MVWLTATTYCLTTVFVALATYIVYRFFKFKAFYDSLPGIDDFRWTTGNLHTFKKFNEEGFAYLYKMSLKHPNFFRIWIGPLLPIVSCYDAELIKAILHNSSKPADSFLATSVYGMAVPWLGDGLILSRGAKWKRNRRLLTPAFHGDALKSFLKTYNEAGNLIVREFSELGDGGKKPVNVQKLLSREALKVLMQCAMSYQSDGLGNSGEYTQAIFDIEQMWTERFLTPLWINPLIYSLTSHSRRYHKRCNYIHDVADEVISKRKKEMEKTPAEEIKVKDFLDMLLVARDEDDQGLSAHDIRSEVDTFMFAGHDSTSIGMSFILMKLSEFPEHQEKCYQEICEVLGNKEDVEWSDLAQLKYVTMCIKESLRHNSTATAISRTLDNDIEFKGTVLPKGTNCILSLIYLHMNPDYWEDPGDYRPERFDRDQSKDMHPYQFLPFSGGSRNCLGQSFAMVEMKVVISKIIRSYTFSLDPEREVRRYSTIALTTESGIHIYFTPRKQAKE